MRGSNTLHYSYYRFYLGLAYAKFYPKDLRQKFDTLKYLQDGIDFVLHDLCEKQQPVAPVCSTRVFVRHSNVLILEGMLELANVLNEHGSPTGNDISRTIGKSIQRVHYAIRLNQSLELVAFVHLGHKPFLLLLEPTLPNVRREVL